jgi:hypothetical protein
MLTRVESAIACEVRMVAGSKINFEEMDMSKDNLAIVYTSLQKCRY